MNRSGYLGGVLDHTTYQPYVSYRSKSYARAADVHPRPRSQHHTEGYIEGTVHSQEDVEDRPARPRERDMNRRDTHDSGKFNVVSGYIN